MGKDWYKMNNVFENVLNEQGDDYINKLNHHNIRNTLKYDDSSKTIIVNHNRIIYEIISNLNVIISNVEDSIKVKIENTTMLMWEDVLFQMNGDNVCIMNIDDTDVIWNSFDYVLNDKKYNISSRGQTFDGLIEVSIKLVK